MKREGGRCFYSLKEVTEKNCVLDHVVPQAEGGDNSYRNIVIATHEVNAMKQGKPADDFIRQLFRKGVLSAAELDDRLRVLEALKKGELKPEIAASLRPD
jgi:CRISPR/Cas system Type II protein with McrA/HNH and RuvC-like nuclease domain